jgi:F0F1-type ATP synthase membrane subunit b/b'
MDRNELRELTEKLEQQRDELRVKAALARAEARDEWDELEEKWDRLKGKLRADGEPTHVTSGS